MNRFLPLVMLPMFLASVAFGAAAIEYPIVLGVVTAPLATSASSWSYKPFASMTTRSKYFTTVTDAQATVSTVAVPSPTPAPIVSEASRAISSVPNYSLELQRRRDLENYRLRSGSSYYLPAKTYTFDGGGGTTSAPASSTGGTAGAPSGVSF